MNLKDSIKFFSSHFPLSYHIYNENKACNLPISVTLSSIIKGQKVLAWGVGKSEDIAFHKAYMELIERASSTFYCPLYFRKKTFINTSRRINVIAKEFDTPLSLFHPKNSNGCGLGPNLNFAYHSAKFELIERHTILTGLLYDISPINFDLSSITKNYTLPTGYKVQGFYWKVGQHFVTVCMMLHPDKGYYFGSAARNTLFESATKSFEELSPAILYSLTEKTFSDIDIKKNDLSSFSRYWRFSEDDRIEKFFKGSNKNHPSLPVLKNYFYSELIIPDLFGGYEKKMKAVRVVSPEAQQLFFDNWSLDYVNPLYRSTCRVPNFPHFIA